MKSNFTFVVILIFYIPYILLAQTNIDIITQINKPYSPYYSDYFDGNNNTMLIIRNNDQTTHKIKLVGTINGDNGISISTKKDFTPVSPLILLPNQVLTLTGQNLRNYLGMEDINVIGIDKSILLRSSALPEGNYDICFQALDYDTSEPLSLPSPSGCGTAEIIFPDAPQLILPNNEDSVITQNGILPVNFTWIPPIPTPLGIKYILQIAEYFNPSLDPNSLLDATTKYYYEKELQTTTFITLPNDPPLLDNRTYCWRVIAFDPFGKTQFKNNGKSIAFIFTVKKNEEFANLDTSSNTTNTENNNNNNNSNYVSGNLKIQIPNCDKAQDYPDPNKFMNLNKLNNTSNESSHYQDLLNKYGKDVPIVEVNNKRDFYVVWSIIPPETFQNRNINYKLNFTNQQNLTVASFNKVSQYTDISQAFAYFILDKQSAHQYFQHNFKYTCSIEAYDSVNIKIAVSPPCTFRYIETADTLKSSNLQTYTIKGTIKYIFQGYDYEHYPSNLNSIKLKKMLLIKDSYGNILGKGIQPTDFQNLTNITPNSILFNTSDDGSFNVQLNSTQDAGFLGNVTNYIYKDLANNTTKSISGQLFEYYTIDLTSPYFINPTTEINLNSNNIDLGEIITNVISYQLTINIQKKFKNGNFVNLSPEGIKVTIYRMQSVTGVPYYEGEVNINSQKVQSYQIKQVATGKVQQVIGPDGKIHTVALIDKLICNQISGDNYMIDVIQEVVENGQKKTYISDYWLTSFAFKPNLWNYISHILNNNYNFNTSITATIISQDPPTATIKGQLVSTDPNNPNSTISPMKYKKVGLMVTYLIQNTNGNITTVLDSAHVVDAIAKHNNDAIGGMNTGQYADTLGNALRNPFNDGNTIIATTYTDGLGNFSFDNFAHLDSLGYWNSSGHFGKGSGEFCNIAHFNGKVIRTLRLVLVGNEQQYYYNPSTNINVQPLDSTYIGVLKAFTRSYSLTVVPRKNPNNQEQYEPSGVIYGSKVKVSRFDLIPYKEDYVTTSNGTTFFGLFLHNYQINWDDYKIEVSTSDTTGDNAYYTKQLNFPRDYDDWKQDTIYTNNKQRWTDYGKKGNYAAASQSQVICQNYETKNLNDFKRLFFADDYVRLFTDDYVLIRDTINIYLDPKQGIISGRILDATNPMRSVKSGVVVLYTGDNDNINNMQPYNSGGLLSGLRYISEENQHGYFVFKDLPNNPNKKYRLKIVCPGYSLYQTKTGKDSTTQNLTGDYIPPFNNSGITVKIGQHWFFPQILMMPKGTIKGYVVNEQEQSVEAYIRTTTSKMCKTSWVYSIDNSAAKQTFAIKSPTLSIDTLFIIPLDLKYFADTILIPKISDDTPIYNVGKVIVKERKHRIRFHILDNITKQSIPNLTIELLDLKTYTGNSPLATTFVFKNASLQNFWLKITPDSSSDYIPLSLEFTNAETKDYIDYTIFMKKGFAIAGKVTNNGHPVSNAMIYVVNGNSMKKTFSDAQGNYTLKGIQTSSHYQKNSLPFADIYCVPPSDDNSVSLIGTKIRVNFSQQKETVNFDLKSLDNVNLSQFYGFKSKITKLVELGNSKYKISGTLDLTQSNSDFKLIDNNQNITFTDILVQPSNQYKDKNKKSYLENIAAGGSILNYIPLDLPSLKIKFIGENANSTSNNNTINILLSPINWGSGNSFIQLYKENPISGHIQSNARIVDNSFNFPGSYFRFEDNQFYLAKENNGGFSRIIQSFSSSDSTNNTNINQNQFFKKSPIMFHLCDETGNSLQFKFLEFSAQSEVKNNELLQNGSINISPFVSTNIRLDPQNSQVTPISFQIPKIVILPDSMYTTTKISKIEVQLEQWQLIANNCEVNSDIGGLQTNDAIIKTGSFDIPVKDFNLRADFLYLNKLELTNIKLGNGKNLELKINNPQFGIDPYCGLDLKPHFKLSLIGNPAAQVAGLPGFGNNPLQFQAISLLSNGEKIISFAPNSEKIALFNVANFKPLTISNYDDAFFLDGLLDLDIPRLQNGLSCRLKFFKLNNKDTVTVMPGDITFEGPGYVQFLSKMNTDKQIFTNNQLKFYGKVWEDGKLNSIDVVLIKNLVSSQWVHQNYIFIVKNPEKNIQYFPSEAVPMDTRYLIDSARMEVKANDWGILKLKLDPTSAMAAKGYGSEPLRLAIYGEIKTDPESPNKIAVSNIQTPFGDFSLSFDFANLRLIGSLNIPPTQVGTMNMTGAAEMCIDKSGFYMVATGKGVVDAVGAFAIGILIGNYAGGNSNGYKDGLPESAYNLVTANSIGKGLPCEFEGKSTFSGFFVTGRYSLPIVTYNKSFDLVIVSAHVQTEAGFEASAWASFNSPIGLGLSAIAYAYAELGINSIACTDLEAKAQLVFKGQVSWMQGQSFTLQSSASLNIYGLLEQKIPTPFGCGATIFKLGSDTDPLISFISFISINKNTGVKFYFGEGDAANACSSTLTK